MLALAVLFTPLVCRGADVGEADVGPRNKKIYLEPEKSALERGKFKFLTAVTAGYDNNTFLNTRRDGDPYMQEFVRGAWTSDTSKKTVTNLEAEFMNLMYAGESALDLVRGGLRAGVDRSLSKQMSVSFGYNLDIVEYINAGEDDYYENSLSSKLSQKFGKKMFQSFMYSPSYRNYTRRYTNTVEGAAGSEKKRADLRHTLEYEIGKYFTKDMVKLNLQYFNNNSNDPYLNYYDYDSYRIGGSLTHLFNDKVSGYLGLWNQYRFFRTRTLISDAGSKEEDTTFLLTSSIFYTVNKSLAFGLSYTYRQNYSNEPIERYSGSLISASTYYKF